MDAGRFYESTAFSGFEFMYPTHFQNKPYIVTNITECRSNLQSKVICLLISHTFMFSVAHV